MKRRMNLSIEDVISGLMKAGIINRFVYVYHEERRDGVETTLVGETEYYEKYTKDEINRKLIELDGIRDGLEGELELESDISIKESLQEEIADLEYDIDELNIVYDSILKVEETLSEMKIKI